MHMKNLILQTHLLNKQKTFYHSILGLPLLAETTNSFTLQAGTTRLHFQQSESDVLYHLAFAVPPDTFPQAKERVHKHVPLLATTGSQRAYTATSPLRMWNKVGEDEIFFPVINARLFYCRDAANNILKFIVYYDLDEEATGADGANSVLHVSEVGLPVEDVQAFSTRLMEQLEIEPYPASRPVSEDFAYLGDASGQLVVVRSGHPWLPTQTVMASVAPVNLTISGQQEQQIQFSPYPYKITVTAS
jgi:catechol 2,3-dioxygenase-like lactoylglutathione lyase family enzyme